MRIANTTFAQRDWAIEQAYLERIGSTFGAGVRLVDYRTDYETARKLINAWVSDQTKKRIPALIPEGGLDDAHPAGSRQRGLPQGRLGDRVLQGGGDGAQAVHPSRRLACRGPDDVPAGRPDDPLRPGERLAGDRAAVPGRRPSSTPLAMTLILPDDLPSFESKLSATQLSRITTALESERERLEVITPGTSGEDCDMGTWPYEVESSCLASAPGRTHLWPTC